MDVLNAFTVDVEDYFQVSAFEHAIARSSWGSFESRVVANTQRLLALLACHRVQATFFVLGWVAERFPGLIQEIVALGHQVGSHSYWHRLIYEMTPEEFREDLRRSIGVLEDAGGTKINCYRAPSFSIIRQSQWALEILAEEGIEIDSSIFPVRHDRYGIPDANPKVHVRPTKAGPMIEFPPTIVEFAGLRLPVGGGGYFRLYPLSFTTGCLRKINAQGRPCMFYIHPWEVDPHQPRLRVAGPIKSFRHYLNLRQTEARLDKLLSSFCFGTVQAALEKLDLKLSQAVAV